MTLAILKLSNKEVNSLEDGTLYSPAPEVEPVMEIRDKAKLIPRPQPTGAVPDDGAGPVNPIDGFSDNGTRIVLLKV